VICWEIVVRRGKVTQKQQLNKVKNNEKTIFDFKH